MENTAKLIFEGKEYEFPSKINFAVFSIIVKGQARLKMKKQSTLKNCVP